MKQTNVKVLALVAALIMGNVAYGYTFDFTNTLKGPVEVRIKLSGINEPWYQRTLQGKNQRMGRSYGFNFNLNAQELNVGATGSQTGSMEYTGRKVAFCLSQIQVAPWEMNKKTKEWEKTDEWYDLAPKFIETNYFNKMLQAAGAVADGSLGVAGKIIEAIAEAAEADQAVKAGGALKEANIGGLVEAIGGVVSISLCKDRSFTILPNIDESGEIVSGYFLITNER